MSTHVSREPQHFVVATAVTHYRLWSPPRGWTLLWEKRAATAAAQMSNIGSAPVSKASAISLGNR
jgi:hypothetical protein